MTEIDSAKVELAAFVRERRVPSDARKDSRLFAQTCGHRYPADSC